MEKYTSVAPTYKPISKLSIVALVFSIVSFLAATLFLNLGFFARLGLCPIPNEAYYLSAVLLFLPLSGIALGLSVGSCCIPERSKTFPVWATVLGSIAVSMELLVIAMAMY